MTGLRILIGRYWSILGVRGNTLFKHTRRQFKCLLLSGVLQYPGSNNERTICAFREQYLQNKPSAGEHISDPQPI
jgi:hypothetical protein